MQEIVNRLNEQAKFSGDEYRDVRLHLIENQEELKPLGVSSRLHAKRASLPHFRDIGRAAAEHWLNADVEQVGQRSTVDRRAMLEDIGAVHHG